ncbi:MAG TPA: alpha/beta hydrolase [Pyrinomonadaceae bacterium]|jgi:pimeloyl-ACP methyl ester carboxylesterase|nr:alpha/beta hydrolase [Pyrinomonadaceae bacterium]
MTAGQTSAPNILYKEVYGTGDPILCLHGLGANLYSFRHFIAPFSQNNKLILVDFKGCGKSPKPRDRRYSIEEKAADIYNLILEEDLTNLTLVGNSLGGAIALLVAVRLGQEEPHRLARLILIDSAGDTSSLPPHLNLLRSAPGTPIIYLAPSKLAARITLRMCYYDRSKITKEQVKAYAAPISGLGGRHALLQTARQCIPANADELIASARSITVPTLILWGREDKVIPLRVGELLHNLLPNSTLEVIEECGHIPQEEKPEETISLISNFLKATA